jgi:biotin carboxylase
MPPRLLLACPATSYRLAAFVRAARALGVELVVASDMAGEARRHGCAQLPVDFGDIEGSRARLRAALTSPFDGVLAVDEKSALLAAACGADERLSKRRYHTTEGVEATRDKRLMRRRLAEAGVPVPPFQVVLRDGAVVAPAFPCVVKPPMLSGSQGVLRADTPAELEQAVARIRRILDRHPSARPPGFFDLLVERYVDGDEVAVEALATEGSLEVICIFDKPDPLIGPTFEETLYVTPSRKPAEVQRRIVDVTTAAARALGLVEGPVHAELRMGRDGEPMLIEIAARSIGGMCSRALVHLVGSLEELLIRAALGMSRAAISARTASGVMMIPVPASGVLRGVRGIERARALEGVDAVEVTIAPGEAVRRLPEGDRYLGFVFAHGDTAERVEASLRAAHACLQFDLKPLLLLA